MRQRKHRLAEMNVVPYIDVMLVLLIIFMITSPLLTQGVDVNLPTVKQAKTLMPEKKPIVVTMNAKGEIFLEYEDKPRALLASELVMEIKNFMATTPNLEVLIKGDSELPYGEVIEMMGLLRAAGIDKVGLITKPPHASDKR